MTCTSLKKFTGWIQSEGAIDRLENVRLAYKELVNEARKETTATVIVAKVCLFWEMGFQGVNLGLRRHFFLSFENSDKIKFHKKTLRKSIDRTCIFQSGTINRNPMVVVGGVDPEGIFPCTMHDVLWVGPPSDHPNPPGSSFGLRTPPWNKVWAAKPGWT